MKLIFWLIVILTVLYFSSTEIYDYAYQKGYVKGYEAGYATKRAHYMKLWATCEYGGKNDKK